MTPEFSYEAVLEAVRRWPAQQRVELTRALIETLHPSTGRSHEATGSPEHTAHGAGFLREPLPVLEYAGPLRETGGVWRDGRLLVARKDAAFTSRCIECGAAANGQRIRRTFQTHPLSPRTATVEYAVCDAHRARRRRHVWASVAYFLVAGLFLFLCMRSDLRYGPLAVLALAGGVLSGATTGCLTVKQIDAQFVWLTGAGEGFLETLPLADFADVPLQPRPHAAGRR